jgi:hypothetical protein
MIILDCFGGERIAVKTADEENPPEAKDFAETMKSGCVIQVGPELN